MKLKNGLKELEGLFGDRFSDSLIDRIAYSGDVWILYLLKSLNIKDINLPSAVIWPKNTDEVIEAVKIARDYKIPLYTYGGGAGVTGAVIPTTEHGVVIDLKLMNKILEFDEISQIVKVEAGVIAQHLEDRLNRRGFMFPHYPMSMWTSTIGGFIATRASGILSTKYGSMEDLVIGLQVVTGTGELLDFPPQSKTSMGPDLKRIFMGSEGTLGIITNATLRIYKIPEKLTFRVYLFEQLNEAINFIREILQSGIKPPLIRLYDEMDTSVTFSRFGISEGNLLIMMFDEPQPIVEGILKKIEDIEKRHTFESLEEKIGYEWWHHRYHKYLSVPDAVNLGVVDTIEIYARWSKIYELYTRVKKAIEENESMAMAHLSHFYIEGAAIYFTFISDYSEENLFENYRRAWEAAVKECLNVGGKLAITTAWEYLDPHGSS